MLWLKYKYFKLMSHTGLQSGSGISQLCQKPEIPHQVRNDALNDLR